jgi:CRP-like cAMP-binding protein
MTRHLRPTAADTAAYAAALRRIAPLDDEAIRSRLSEHRVQELDTGEHFLLAGRVATHAALVVRGVLREYFVMPNGLERTKTFVPEGEFAGSMADLLSGEPARAFSVAEEPCRLLVIAFEDVLADADDSPAWGRWYRHLLERLFVGKALREYELLGLDAAGRYREFGTRYPGLEGRIAARHVASYLGITPVHLSRLRRNDRARRLQQATRAPHTVPTIAEKGTAVERISKPK